MADLSGYLKSASDEIKEWTKQGQVYAVFIDEPKLKDFEKGTDKYKQVEGLAEISMQMPDGKFVLKGQHNLRLMKQNVRALAKLLSEDTNKWVGKKFQVITVSLADSRTGTIRDCLYLRYFP